MSQTKCGFVTIIGSPNAGKSSLTNLLVGSKISIVTPKVQTTRSTIRAISFEDNCQIIFCDTPGIFKANRTLEQAIVENAIENITSDSKILMLVDVARESNPDDEVVFQTLKKFGREATLILNKIDLIEEEKLKSLREKYQDLEFIDKVFEISVLEEKGISELKDYLKEIMPESPFLYPEDQLTDLPSRFLAQEITREKLFLELSKELPYNISVETDSWKVKDNGDVVIDQTIYVMKEGQKKIVIGAGGRLLKEIGSKARVEMQEVFGAKIHLFLHVKVRPDFLEKPYMYSHMGLRFPKKKKGKK